MLLQEPLKNSEIASVNLLKEISCFGALSEETICFLLNHGEVLKSKEGTYIFEAGDIADGFYIILSGKLTFTKHTDEIEAFIRNYQLSEHISVAGMITLKGRVGDTLCVEDSQLLYVSYTLFNQLYERNSQDFTLLLMNIVRDMAKGVSF